MKKLKLKYYYVALFNFPVNFSVLMTNQGPGGKCITKAKKEIQKPHLLHCLNSFSYLVRSETWLITTQGKKDISDLGGKIS